MEREGGKESKEKGRENRKKPTALLDALDRRIADSLIDRINRILNRGPGILLRVRARGEAERLAAGSYQRGARSSQRDGSEERHDSSSCFFGVLDNCEAVVVVVVVVVGGGVGFEWIRVGGICIGR